MTVSPNVMGKPLSNSTWTSFGTCKPHKNVNCLTFFTFSLVKWMPDSRFMYFIVAKGNGWFSCSAQSAYMQIQHLDASHSGGSFSSYC